MKKLILCLMTVFLCMGAAQAERPKATVAGASPSPQGQHSTTPIMPELINPPGKVRWKLARFSLPIFCPCIWLYPFDSHSARLLSERGRASAMGPEPPLRTMERKVLSVRTMSAQ